MRLAKIALRNYRTYGAADMEINQGIALLLGRNGVGKTGLRDGVRISLTGKCEGMGRGGFTIDRLIRHGEPTGGIQTTWARDEKDPLVVERRLTPKGLGTKLNGAAVEGGVADYFAAGVDPDTLLALIVDPEALLSGDAGKQKEIVLALISRDVPEAALSGLPLNRLPAPPKTLDDMEAALEIAVAGRRAAKASLDVLADLVKPGEPAPNVDAMEKALDGLRVNARGLAEAMGEQAGERRALQSERDAITKELDSGDKRLVGLGTLAEAETLLSRSADALTLANDAVKAWETKSKAAGAKDFELEEATNAKNITAKAKGGCCPTCRQTVDLNGLRGFLEKRVKDLGKEAKDLKTAAGAKPDTRTAQQNVGAAEEKIKQINDLTGSLKARRERASVLDKRIAEIDGGETAKALVEVEGRITNGSALIGEGRKLVTAWAEYDRTLKSREMGGKAVAEWDALAQAFGPKGIPVRLIGERVGAFQDAVNARLKGFGLTFQIVPDPWEVRTNNSHPVLMSRAQRLMVGLAVQIVVAGQCGIKWVAVDGADILDGPNRSEFFRLLHEAVTSKALDGALVTATYSNDDALKRDRYPAWLDLFVATAGETGTTIRRVA